MSKKKVTGTRISLGLASILIVVAILAIPLMASASSGNRVNYMPVESTFTPAGSFGSDIAEGGGNGINKLTLNAGPNGYIITFQVATFNEKGVAGTTLFEVRKGPGNVDLSPGVQLSADGSSWSAPGATTNLTYSGSETENLWVTLTVPPCTGANADGTFRIQAHPGGTAHQGNGPGVVVFLKCTDFTPGDGGSS